MRNLKRNDVDAAVEAYRDAVLGHTWTPEFSTVLIQLQDDPTELKQRLTALSREPEMMEAMDAIHEARRSALLEL